MGTIEALWIALSAVRAHKLRSILTLVGIVAGVASIIAVMTGISVVQVAMEQEMSVLGTQTFQVQKWPRGNFGNDIDWRKIQRRKPVTVANADVVREKVANAVQHDRRSRDTAVLGLVVAHDEHRVVEARSD